MRLFNKVEIKLLRTSPKHSMKIFDQIHYHVSRGEKLKATKLYRNYKTDIGCSLKEAYDYILQLEKTTAINKEVQ